MLWNRLNPASQPTAYDACGADNASYLTSADESWRQRWVGQEANAGVHRAARQPGKGFRHSATRVAVPRRASRVLCVHSTCVHWLCMHLAGRQRRGELFALLFVPLRGTAPRQPRTSRSLRCACVRIWICTPIYVQGCCRNGTKNHSRGPGNLSARVSPRPRTPANVGVQIGYVPPV